MKIASLREKYKSMGMSDTEAKAALNRVYDIETRTGKKLDLSLHKPRRT